MGRTCKCCDHPWSTYEYHLHKNEYRCKSLINSKTIPVSKKNTGLFLQDLLIPKTSCPCDVTDLTDIADFYRVQDHGRWCVGAHFQAVTFSSQDHGRLSIARISKHSQQKLAHVLDSLVHTGNTRAVDTSTRADACAFTSDPQPRLFEFTSL